MFDGMAARKYNQCSTFGGLIDMVTDRCSTAGLLCVLSREYSEEPTLVLVRRVCEESINIPWIDFECLC
jgi:phosphatidylglycerophosphate synthase